MIVGENAWLSGPYSSENSNFEIVNPPLPPALFKDTRDGSIVLHQTDIGVPVSNASGDKLRFILGGDSFGPTLGQIQGCPSPYYTYPDFLGNAVFIQATVRMALGSLQSVEFSANEIDPIDGDSNIINLDDDEIDFNIHHAALFNPTHPEDGHRCYLSVYPVDYFYVDDELYVVTGTTCWGLDCEEPSCWDDPDFPTSQYIGKGIFRFDNKERIPFNLYENDTILWGWETHFGNIAVIRETIVSPEYVCFIGTQRPKLEDILPVYDEWKAMLACLDRYEVYHPDQYFYYIMTETGCRFEQMTTGHAPIGEVECPVASDDHLAPTSVELFNGQWRMLYRAIYPNDPDMFMEWRGEEYRTVKILRTDDLLDWPISRREVHPLTNLPRYDGGYIQGHYAPKWYPPSAISAGNNMYFNTSIKLVCGENGEISNKFMYNLMHYRYYTLGF